MPDVFGGSFVGASLGSVRGIISLDAAPALAALAAVGEGARKLGDDTAASAGRANDGLRTIGAGMAVAGAGILGFAAAVGVSAVQAASKFQASMELIHTQAGATQQEVSAMSADLLALSGKVGFGPEELSQALFHLESAGFRGKQALDGLTIAAEGAKVGQANLVDVTNALDAVMVAGGKDAQNLSGTMGELNAIVGSGDMHMQDLANAFGTGIIATAHTFGLNVQDIGAALAVMGDNNIRGSDAATKLRMSISLMAAPSSAAAKQLASIGLSSMQLADDMRQGGIIQALEDLKQHLADSGKTATEQATVISKAFGGGKSGGTIQLLLEQLDRLKQKYGEIGAGANKFGADWQATTETAAFQSAKLHATLDALKVAIGIGLLPAFNAFLEAVTPIALALARWAAAHEKLSGVILIAVGALGALLTVVGVGILIFPTLAAAVAVLLSPIALAAAAAVALGAALAVAFGTNFLGFGDAVRGVADAVRRAAFTFVDLIRSGINPLSAALFALGPLFPKFLQGPLFAAADAIDHLGAGIDEFLTVAKRFYDLQGIGGVLDYFGIRLFNAFGQPALDIFLAFRDAVGAVVTGMRAVLADLGNLFHDVVHGNIDQALHDMVSLFKDAMLGLADAALIVPRLVLSAFVAVDWTAVGATLSKGLAGALALVSGAGASLVGLAASIGGSILAAVGNIDWGGIGDAIASGLGAAVHAVKFGVIELGRIGAHVAGWLVDGAKDLWDKVVKFATDIWGSNTSDPNGGPGIDGTGGAAIPGRTLNLFSIGAHVAGWIADGARDLWDQVVKFGKTLMPKGKDAVVDLGQITASVASWTVGGAADLGDQIEKRVHALFGGGGGPAPNPTSAGGPAPIDLGDWALHVGVPTLVGWVEDAAGWIQDKLESLVHTGKDWYVDLKAWFVSIKKPALDVLDDVGKSLQDKLESLVHTGKDWYVDLKTWLVSIKKPAFDVLDDVGKSLQDKLESLLHTGKDWYVDLKAWFVSIKKPVLDVLDDVGKAIQDTLESLVHTGKDWYVDLRTWLVSIKKPVFDVLDDVGKSLQDEIESLVHTGKDWYVDLKTWFVSIKKPAFAVLDNVADSLQTKLESLVHTGKDWLVDLKAWAVSIPEPHPILWTQDVAGWVKGKIGALFGGGTPGPGFEAHTGVTFGAGPLASVTGWTLDVGIPTAVGWVKTAATWVHDTIAGALKGVDLTDVGAGVGAKVSAALNGIKWGDIGQDFGYAAGTALAAGLKLVGALVAVAVGALASGDLVKAVVNLGASLVTGFATGFSKALADQFPGLGPAITKALKPVTDAFDALPKSVQDTIKKFGDALGGWAGPAFKFGVVAAGLTLVLDAFVPAVGALAAAAFVLDPELLVMALAFAGLYLLVSHVHDLAKAVQALADATKKMTGLSLGTIIKDIVTGGNGLGPVVDNVGKLADSIKKLNDDLQGNTAADHFKQLGGALAVVALAAFFVAPEFVGIALVAAGLAFAASEVAKHWDDVVRVFKDVYQPAKDAYDALHKLTGLDLKALPGVGDLVRSIEGVATALHDLAVAYKEAAAALAWAGLTGSKSIASGFTGPGPQQGPGGSGPDMEQQAKTAIGDIVQAQNPNVAGAFWGATPGAGGVILQTAAAAGVLANQVGAVANAAGGAADQVGHLATQAQTADAAFAHLVTQGHAYAALVTAGANITAAGGVPGVGGGPSLGSTASPLTITTALPSPNATTTDAYNRAYGDMFNALRKLHDVTAAYVASQDATVKALGGLKGRMETAGQEFAALNQSLPPDLAPGSAPRWVQALKALADPRGLGSAGSNLVGGGTPGLGTIPQDRGANEARPEPGLAGPNVFALPRLPLLPPVQIKADTRPFETGLAHAGGLGVAFAAKPILPKADADTAPFVAGIARLAALGAGFAAHAFRAKGDVDTTGAGKGIGAVLAAGTAFAAHVFKAKTDADPATALKGIGAVLAAGTAFAGKTFSATVAVHAVEAKDSFAKSPAAPGVGDALAGVQATGLAAQGTAAAKSFLDAFAKGLAGVGPALAVALADVGARAAAMAAIAGQVGTAGGVGLVAALAKALAAVGTTMAALLAGIGAEAGAMVAIAGQVGTAGGTSLNAGLKTALGGVNATMASLLAGVGGYAGPFSAIGGQVGNAGGASFALGFGNAGRAAIGYAADIGNGVFAALNLNLYNLGANAGSSFANGLAAQAQAAANAAYAVAAAAQSAMQTTLGVFSPSRVFRKIADFVVAGFVQGLQAGVDPVRRATEALVTLPTPSAASASSPLANQPTRGAAATQINVVNVQALKSTELIELMKQAENGDTAFAYTQLLNNGWAAMVALGSSGGQP